MTTALLRNTLLLKGTKKVKKIHKKFPNSPNLTKLKQNMQDVNLYKSITNIDPGTKGQGHKRL
jgi:hypothetical protein